MPKRGPFGGRTAEDEAPEAQDEAQGEPQGEAASEPTSEPQGEPQGEAASDQTPPVEVHQGYSGSGQTNGLRLPSIRKVSKGESIRERQQREAREKAAAEGSEILKAIAANSPDGEWVEFEVSDEAEAKKYRRLINSAAETHERNFTVAIDAGAERDATNEDGSPKVNEDGTPVRETPWLVQARMNRKTGAGRPRQNGQAQDGTESNGEAEDASTSESEG